MKDYIVTIVGTNHNYSDVETRQKLAFENNTLDVYLKTLKQIKHIKEVMILSTCNRVEVICVSEEPVEDKITEFLSDHSGLNIEALKEILYVKKDMDAVRHIFKVASSLDSMVVGEPQILGQIKEAYRWSVEFMTSGVVINRIMRRAFHTAKVVKSKTEIAKGAVSLAYAAVLKVKQKTDIANKRILNVGVGEMNRLACEHFEEFGAKIAYIANRTKKNALEIAEKHKAKVIGLKDIPSVVNEVDIIITSTSSKKPVIMRDFVKGKGKLLIIDMAVPRDTEGGIEKENGVDLVLLDDLKSVIDESVRFRNRQAAKALKIIEEELEAYKEYVESLDYDEIIKKLRIIAERIRKKELNRFKKMYKDDLDDEVLEGVDRLTHSLINKILHEPTRNIKLFIEHPEGDMYVELLKRIFKIENVKKDVKCFFSENSSK